MTVPDKIWKDANLDTTDKLILGLIANGGGSREPADIAKELKATQKCVKQKINRMAKEGWLSITKTDGKVHMEVQHA